MPSFSARSCCICGNKSGQYSLHSFPSEKYNDIYEQWIDIIGGFVATLSPKTVRKKGRVCEVHFSRSQYYIARGNQRRLKKNSVPAVGIGIPVEESQDSPPTPRHSRTEQSARCTPPGIRNQWHRRSPDILIENEEKPPTSNDSFIFVSCAEIPPEKFQS